MYSVLVSLHFFSFMAISWRIIWFLSFFPPFEDKAEGIMTKWNRVSDFDTLYTLRSRIDFELLKLRLFGTRRARQVDSWIYTDFFSQAFAVLEIKGIEISE